MPYPKPYDKVVIAAIRWQDNRKECRRLLRALRPCEEEAEPPCWKRTGGADPYSLEWVPHPLCDACQHNADHIVPALKAARSRRGGLTSALARAVDRFVKETEGV
jgi:hypothetical protein